MLSHENTIVDDAPRAWLGIASVKLAVPRALGQKTCIAVAAFIPMYVLALSSLWRAHR